MYIHQVQHVVIHVIVLNSFLKVIIPFQQQCCIICFVLHTATLYFCMHLVIIGILWQTFYLFAPTFLFLCLFLERRTINGTVTNPTSCQQNCFLLIVFMSTGSKCHRRICIVSACSYVGPSKLKSQSGMRVTFSWRCFQNVLSP